MSHLTSTVHLEQLSTRPAQLMMNHHVVKIGWNGLEPWNGSRILEPWNLGNQVSNRAGFSPGEQPRYHVM